MTEKITYKSWAKKLAKNVKNWFFEMYDGTYFQQWFWIWSDNFRSGQKLHLKN